MWANGCFTNSNGGGVAYSAHVNQANSGSVTYNINASRSSSIYGASSTVQPSAISLIPQIKF